MRAKANFTAMGARIHPEGVLLVGPPGTGETLFCKGRCGRSEGAVLLNIRFGFC